MVIDLKEVRDDVIGYLVAGVHAFENIDLLDVGLGLILVGGILAANVQYQKWRKARGYRMVLRERKDKIDRILSDILTDGILDAEVAGKMSRQEANAKFSELSKKLDLPDLIPRQRRASIIKDEIKGRFNRGVYGKKPHIVTGKKPAFRERIGTFANQFWRAKGA
jgi:predicted methyltransferase MtxX (methanogen marker protein 4)